MSSALGSFFKKIYLPFIVLFSVAVFFVVYNTYLVDRSIISLRVALSQTAQAKTLDDLQKIKALLKIPILREISKKTISPKTLLSMETAENLASTAKDIDQAGDIRFFLQSVINAKERERGGFLSFLDRINALIFKPQTQPPKEKLESMTRAILAKISSLKDKRLLQEAYYELGNLYTQLSDLPGAEKAFLKVIDLDPKTEIAFKSRFNLAWAYKTFGEYDKADAYFKALEKETCEAELATTSRYEIADVLYKKGEYNDSCDLYVQLARENPQFEALAIAFFQACNISQYRLNDFKQALQFLYEFALTQGGYISFFNLKDLKAALKYFSELEKNLPKAEATRHEKYEIRNTMAKGFRFRGYRMLKLKKYEDAIKSFKKAIEVYPADGQSFVGIGLAYYWLKEKPEAVYYAKEAYDTKPEDEIVMANTLFIYINSDAIDEAIRVGEEFLASRKLAVRVPEFYYNLGYAYAIKAKINKATTNFDRAIRLNKEFAFAYNNLGCVLWALKNYSESIKKFKQAIDRNPSYTDAYYNLAIAYFLLNRYEDAYKTFEKVLDIDPSYVYAQRYMDKIQELLKYKP